MAIQHELTDALEQGRDEVVRVMAAHRVVPVVIETESSSLLGKSKAPQFSFERQTEDETTKVADRQTRMRVVDALGMTSEEDCESVATEIQSHDEWGNAV